VVSDCLELEVGDAPEVLEFAGSPVNVIAAPLDFRSGIDLVAEQRKLVSEDSVRNPDDFVLDLAAS
jgi:hypothetical protein